MTNVSTRIAIIGIGNVGVPVLDSLLAFNVFDKPSVVLSREPSANKNLESLTKTTTISQVGPEDTAAVVKVLQDHKYQALVATIGGANGPAQQPLLDVAKQARVELFVSAEFGVDFREIPDAELHPWTLARKQFHTSLNEVCTATPSTHQKKQGGALCTDSRFLCTTEWRSLNFVGYGFVR